VIVAKEELLNTLRGLLRDVVAARFEGGAYAKLSRVHGYADGYMAALLDAGIVEERSLLEVIRDERSRQFAGRGSAHEHAEAAPQVAH
jgi:hypothetical protein